MTPPLARTVWPLTQWPAVAPGAMAFTVMSRPSLARGLI